MTDELTPNKTSPSATPSKQGSGLGGGGSGLEFEPPLACVRRLLKNALPSSTNVGKDASSAFTRACGIFIVYLTACANDFARENKRQTITANDILAAVKEVDFDEFTPQLTEFLEKHRKAEKLKRERKKSIDDAENRSLEEAEDADGAGDDLSRSQIDEEDDQDESPEKKKLKLSLDEDEEENDDEQEGYYDANSMEEVEEDEDEDQSPAISVRKDIIERDEEAAFSDDAETDSVAESDNDVE